MDRIRIIQRYILEALICTVQERNMETNEFTTLKMKANKVVHYHLENGKHHVPLLLNPCQMITRSHALGLAC